MKSVGMGISVPIVLFEQLCDQSKAESVTVQALIRRVLREYFEENSALPS